MSSPPYRGYPPFQSGGQNWQWPTSGQIGYFTPALRCIPNASLRGTKLVVAHKRQIGDMHPCRLGGGGGALLQSNGEHRKWPTSVHIGYVTPAV